MTKQHANLRNKIITIIIVVILLLGIILICAVHHYVKTATKPLHPTDTKVVQMQVPTGESNLGIGMLLQNNHLIRSGHIFDYYVKAHNIKNLKSGYYEFSPSMNLAHVIKIIHRGGEQKPLKQSKIIKKRIRIKKRVHHKIIYKNKVVRKRVKVIEPQLIN